LIIGLLLPLCFMFLIWYSPTCASLKIIKVLNYESKLIQWYVNHSVKKYPATFREPEGFSLFTIC
jgi:hypothetical protein